MPPPVPLDRILCLNHNIPHPAINHKANAPPIVIPATAMVTEVNGSCSMGEAELDPLVGVEEGVEAV
jgi:hypothetical protein